MADSVSAQDDILTTEQIREGFADVSHYITDWERKELRGQFDEWLSSLLATARADGDAAGWEGIDTSQSPTLAAAREASTFGIRLSNTEAAYIAEAVIAASGLRAVVPLTTEEKK